MNIRNVHRKKSNACADENGSSFVELSSWKGHEVFILSLEDFNFTFFYSHELNIFVSGKLILNNCRLNSSILFFFNRKRGL